MSDLPKFLTARSGNVAIGTALIFPILLLIAGAGIDYIQYTNQRNDLQKAADASALAGAKRFTLASADITEIQSIVLSEIDYHMEKNRFNGAFSKSAIVTEENSTVTTSISQKTEALFLDKFLPEEITVNSEAVAAGTVKLCALGLNDRDMGTLSLERLSRLEANDCSVFSNSTDPAGISVDMKAYIDAEVICSSGGVIGNESNFKNEPILDCPHFKDPLKDSVMAPSFGGCDEQDFVVGENAALDLSTRTREERTLDISTTLFEAYTLTPGVYCGGIHVQDRATVTFEPGIYIIKDGPLIFDQRAILEGTNVAFYFTGENATYFIGRDAVVDFTAPKDGPMAGILFMQDSAITGAYTYTIESNDARTLLGTIYLPNGVFRVDTNQPVGDESAYTVIVANRIELDGRPSLFLNTNYSATDIPVPDGVGPIGGTTYLRK